MFYFKVLHTALLCPKGAWQGIWFVAKTLDSQVGSVKPCRDQRPHTGLEFHIFFYLSGIWQNNTYSDWKTQISTIKVKHIMECNLKKTGLESAITKFQIKEVFWKQGQQVIFFFFLLLLKLCLHQLYLWWLICNYDQLANAKYCFFIYN